MSEYTPEEVGRMLGNRVVQPHYAACLVRKAIAQATDTLRAEVDRLRLELKGCTGITIDAERASDAVRAVRAFADGMCSLTLQLTDARNSFARLAAVICRQNPSRNRLRQQHKLKARGKNWRAVK